MATKSSTTQSGKWKTGRLDVYGDLPIRGVSLAARTCPFFLEPILLFGYSLITFILLKAQRRAVAENLKVLCPESSPLQVWRETFAVFYEFSVSISDAAYVRCGRDMLTWVKKNPASFDKLYEGHEHGAILLTAHMGNYDLAGSLFSNTFPTPIHSVRAPERDPLAQEAKEKQLARESSAGFVIHYNRGSEDLLGMELAKVLSRGKIVAIQGDRILFDVSGLDVAVPGTSHQVMKIPAGPFVLAQISGAEIFPFFVWRSGHRQYSFTVHEPIGVEKNRSHRKEAQMAGASEWMRVLISTLKRHRTQWLVFERAFFESEGADGGEWVDSTPNDTVVEEKTVRQASVSSAGLFDSQSGAVCAFLLVTGAVAAGEIWLTGARWLWLLVATAPLVAFFVLNLLGALTSLLTFFIWPGATAPWKITTFLLGSVLTLLAVVLVATGGLILKLLSLPWLFWISIRTLISSLRPRGEK